MADGEVRLSILITCWRESNAEASRLAGSEGRLATVSSDGELSRVDAFQHEAANGQRSTASISDLQGPYVAGSAYRLLTKLHAFRAEAQESRSRYKEIGAPFTRDDSLAYNLSKVIDGGCPDQLPAGVSRKQAVE